LKLPLRFYVKIIAVLNFRRLRAANKNLPKVLKEKFMGRFTVPAIVFGIGLILIVLSLIKILPNLMGAGGSLIFLALMLFGLSFIPRPESAGDQPPMSSAESLAKIFYSPAEVFQNLRRHPRWLAALLVMSILGGIYLVAFSQRLTPERIGNFVTDKFTQIGLIEIPPDKIAQMRQDSINQYKNPVLQAGNVVSGFVGSFVYFAFLAAIYFAFILAMGGSINYWQALAASVYAAFPVAVIQRVLSLIILFIKDPANVHPLLDQQSLVKDNLGVLFNPAENPVLFALASAIGLLTFYGLWLTAKGLKNAGEKVSGGIAWTVVLVVWLIGVVLSVTFTALFPGFLS
jgi:hypothetical protein